MRGALISFICGIAFGCGASAFAACVPQRSNLDEIVGVGQLGQPVTELSGVFNPDPKQTCDSAHFFPLATNSKGEVVAGCAFSDDKGVNYLTDRDKLMVKDVQPYGKAQLGQLPFGLTKKDRVKDVRRKTAKHLKQKLEIVLDGDEVDIMTSGYCYLNSRGQLFALTIYFTDSHVMGMAVHGIDQFRSGPQS